MKRDMASLLEQTVEYINTMHTVLNEERPACLSKIYTVYQKKLEDHDFFKKSTSKSVAKKRISSSGSRSSSVDTQMTSPTIDYPGFHLTPEQSYVGDVSKRRCLNNEASTSHSDLHSDPVQHGHYYHNWPQQQAPLVESVVDCNNNCHHHYSGIPYGSSMVDCQQGYCGVNSCSTGQDCPSSNYCSQYAVCHNGGDRSQPALINQYPKIYGVPSKVLAGNSHCLPGPSSIDKNGNTLAPEQMFGYGTSQWGDDTPAMDVITRGGNKIPRFNISNLVYKADEEELSSRQSPVTSPESIDQQTDLKPNEFVYPSDPTQRANNPPHLLAPMEMSASSPDDGAASPQLIGVNKLLGNAESSESLRGLSYGGRDMGLLLRASSVSNMLSDVSTTTDGVPRGSFGSTEKSMTPFLGWFRTPSCPTSRSDGDASSGETMGISASHASLKAHEAVTNKGACVESSDLIQTPDMRRSESPD